MLQLIKSPYNCISLWLRTFSCHDTVASSVAPASSWRGINSISWPEIYYFKVNIGYKIIIVKTQFECQSIIWHLMSKVLFDDSYNTTEIMIIQTQNTWFRKQLSLNCSIVPNETLMFQWLGCKLSNIHCVHVHTENHYNNYQKEGHYEIWTAHSVCLFESCPSQNNWVAWEYLLCW